MEKGKKSRNKTKAHTIRTSDGGLVSLSLGRKLAMSAFCTECMGFESDPADCTSKLCALFPFRVRTQRTLKGNPKLGLAKDFYARDKTSHRQEGDPF